jgi:hypothetical protein
MSPVRPHRDLQRRSCGKCLKSVPIRRRAHKRCAVRCSDAPQGRRTGSSYRPVLYPMGATSKAGRLCDRAMRCVGGHSGHRRHLQPISGMAALGVGGKTYLPGIVSAMARARLGPGESQRQLLAQTPALLTEALQNIVSADDLADPWPLHRQPAPMWKAVGQRRYVHRSSVSYGDHPSQVLDVWRSEEHIGTAAGSACRSNTGPVRNIAGRGR